MQLFILYWILIFFSVSKHRKALVLSALRQVRRQVLPRREKYDIPLPYSLPLTQSNKEGRTGAETRT